MATVKVKFRASSVKTKEGALYYQVIHDRLARQIRSGYKLYPSEWDTERSKVILPSGIEEGRRYYLLSVKAALDNGLARFKELIAWLEHGNMPYTADKVLELYASPTEYGGFITYARKLIGELKQIGKICTAETYTTALNSFVRFHGERDLLFEEMDSNRMVQYETYLKENNVCPNSTSYYMRNLRAIYNRAVEEGLTGQRNPFKHVYTGVDKTVKRAVPLKVIRRIREADLTQTPAMDYARDLFLFSFYTRGMSFVDMAYLKKNDLKNGVLIYRRKKTGQQLCIRWERHMQDILEKYPMSQESPYLLPIILKAGEEERKQYNNALHLVNKKLKFISNSLQLTIPLTMYVARHSWATVAKSRNIPLSVISEGMGHDSENTTLIYLASLNTEIIDKANKLILNLL